MKLIQTLQMLAMTALLAAGFGTHATAGEMIPSKGRVTGQNTYGVYTANPFDAQGNPILGLVFRYTESEGTGNGTGLGKFTIKSRNFAELAVVDGNLVVYVTGDWVITAANGDQSWGVHEFTRPLAGDPLLFTGTTTALGGSGRFEGSHGASVLSGVIFPDPVDGLDAFEYEWKGIFSSVGSSKR